MKVFEKIDYSFDKFEYPEDMKKIMDYLESHGKLNVTAKTVETLYEDFSDSQYSASWMCVSHQDWLLEEFADYLSELNF